MLLDIAQLQIRPRLDEHRLPDNMDVKNTQLRQTFPEGFPKEPANPVSGRGTSQYFPRDGNAKPAGSLGGVNEVENLGLKATVRTKPKVPALAEAGGLWVARAVARRIGCRHLPPMATVRRLRPFRRRRAKRSCPSLSDFRFRNPCFRFRLILLGWYVLFTVSSLN